MKAALSPPTGDVVVLDGSLEAEVIEAARQSDRGRMILPLHKSHEDALHRMLNALQPGTYVRPHRHLVPPKSEAWVVLRGAVLFLVFDDAGGVAQAIELAAGGARFGIDLAPGYYHSLIALVPDTVLFEVKPGPYQKDSDKAFAPWAPEEGTPEARTYLEDLVARYGSVGSDPPQE